MSEQKTASILRQPGALRSQTSMEIQTRQAQRLVYGRQAASGKPAIIGLLRFGTMLGPIWKAAAADDPWADWTLVQLEQVMLEGRESMEALKLQVDQKIHSAPSINVAVAHSVEPVTVDLVFSTPYAFMGAYLLADYDAVARSVLTGRHICLYDRDAAEKTLWSGGRIVRRAFTTAQGYKYLGVCREDVRQGTQKAARATESLGQLPQEVLDGTLRAAHAPEIRTSTNKHSSLLEDDSAAMDALLEDEMPTKQAATKA